MREIGRRMSSAEEAQWNVLQSQGVAAMMKPGEWDSEAAAQSYATLDGIDTQKLKAACCSVIDLSDDD